MCSFQLLLLLLLEDMSTHPRRKNKAKALWKLENLEEEVKMNRRERYKIIIYMELFKTK